MTAPHPWWRVKLQLLTLWGWALAFAFVTAAVIVGDLLARWL